MIKDRLVRKLINTKENVIDFKGIPSVGSMADGQIAITKSSNSQLAIHRKKDGKLYKSFMTANGNQIIEKDLTVRGDIVLETGNLNIRNLPIFEAKSTGQSNLAINSATQIQFASEVIDNTSSFSSNSFTAPVAGYYFFYYNLALDAFDTGMTSATISLRSGASDYFASTRVDDKEFSADTDNAVSKSACAVKKLTSGGVVSVYWLQIGGTQQVDVISERNAATDPYPASSSFGGHLISRL